MITRCLVAVIISLISFFAVSQCPDFNPQLEIIGNDTICGLSDSTQIRYSFDGVANQNYSLELYNQQLNQWFKVDTLPGEFFYSVYNTNYFALRISNTDGSCLQYFKDTIDIQEYGINQIYFGGKDDICTGKTDHRFMIDFRKANVDTVSFEIFKNGVLYSSYENFNNDSLVFTGGAGRYSVIDLRDDRGCDMRVRGGNDFTLSNIDKLTLEPLYNNSNVSDTIYVIDSSINIGLTVENFNNNLTWYGDSYLEIDTIRPNLIIDSIRLGVSKLVLSIFNECESINKSLVINRTQPSISKLENDTIRICKSFSNQILLRGNSYSNKLETSYWVDVDGYLGTANSIFTNDSLIIEPPYKSGGYKFSYSIYNSIADSTTSDTLLLSIIDEPSFIFDSPLNSSDTLFTNKDVEDISITANESNYLIEWNADIGNIYDINANATQITQLDNQNVTKVNISVQDTFQVCPIKKDSLWIDLVKQTIAEVEDTLRFCVNQLPDTVFSTNPILEPRFETSLWKSFNSPKDLTSDSSFLALPSILSEGIYYLEYSIYNSIDDSVRKDTMVLIVDQLPEPSAIITSDYSTCNSQESVVAAPLADDNVGIWMDGNQSQLSKTEENTFSLNSGENEFFWIVSNGACQFIDTSSVTITYLNEVTEPTIVISEIPSGDAFVAIDDTLSLCLNGSYQVGFQPNLNTLESFEWLPGQGTNISDPALNPTTRQQNISISGVGLKEYILKAEVENGIDCPTKFDTLQINVIDIPDLSNAFIIKEDTICENTQNNPITVQDVVWGQKYYWLSSSPLLNFESSNLDSTNYSIGVSTLVDQEVDASAEFSVYAENFCGVSNDQVLGTVVVRLAPKSFSSYSTKNIDIEGKDTLCSNLSSSDVITFIIKDQYNTETYVWDFPVVGIIEGDSIVELSGSQVNQISGSAEGAKTISVSLQNECGSFGPINQVVQFQKTEPFSFSLNLPEGQNICPEKIYSIEVNSVFKDSVLLQFLNSTFLERTILPQNYLIKGDSLLNNLGPQLIVSAEIIDKDLCYTEFEDQTSVTVTNVGLSKPGLEQPEPICYGNEIILQENTQQNNYVKAYKWYKNNSVLKESTESFITLEQINESGIYKVELINLYDCQSQVSEEVEVQIFENPNLSISDKYKPNNGPGLDVFVKENQSVSSQLPFELNYQGLENLWYDWKAFSANNVISESESLSFISNLNTYNPDLVVNNYKEDEIIYVLHVSTSFGCSDSDSILVNFIKPFIAPTAFTPNGDNINDTWVLDGLTNFPDAVVSVFNRWGTLVFQKYGGYQGHFSGDELPMGTYYWIVDFKDNSREPESGTVTIIR